LKPVASASKAPDEAGRLGGVDPSIVTLLSAQPDNASSPMDVTLEGMVMLVRALQPSIAPHPMEVTLEGMLTLVSTLQLPNAPCSMEVTLNGMA
jgi:hypothetical protein